MGFISTSFLYVCIWRASFAIKRVQAVWLVSLFQTLVRQGMRGHFPREEALQAHSAPCPSSLDFDTIRWGLSGATTTLLKPVAITACCQTRSPLSIISIELQLEVLDLLSGLGFRQQRGTKQLSSGQCWTYTGILLLHVGSLQVWQAGTSHVKQQLSWRDTGLQVLDEELIIHPSPILIMPNLWNIQSNENQNYSFPDTLRFRNEYSGIWFYKKCTEKKTLWGAESHVFVCIPIQAVLEG